MVQDGVAWFGQSHPHTIKVVAKPDKGARIISHDIPSVVSAGSVFTVHITVRNEGTTTWTQATNFKLGAVDNSDPFAATRQLLGPSDSIAAGQTKTFTFTMTAPNTPGYYYQTDWRMLQESVTWFGQKIDVEVGVN
ncbi:MAG: NBR1-Ig-like domain-containing protein [Phycisphaerae bacterium]